MTLRIKRCGDCGSIRMCGEIAVCPGCGLIAITTDRVSLFKVSGLAAKIFMLLALRPNVTFRYPEIINWIYTDREDGGPEFAHEVLRTSVYWLRRALQREGLDGVICSDIGRDGGYWFDSAALYRRAAA